MKSMKLNPLIVIPARLQASRLPNKPLADIHGKPMIQHVWERCVQANIAPVLVACAEQQVMDVITNCGGQAVLTAPNLPSGSDRVFHAVQQFDPQGIHNVIVNVQGDLPILPPHYIGKALHTLSNSDVHIGTLVSPIYTDAEKNNDSIVKAFTEFANGQNVARALTFTRCSAPWGDGAQYYHIGIYAFRRHALQQFVQSPSTPLEKREKLEQLRALELGMRIDVALVDGVPMSVDTPEDLEKVRTIMEKTHDRKPDNTTNHTVH